MKAEPSKSLASTAPVESLPPILQPQASNPKQPPAPASTSERPRAILVDAETLTDVVGRATSTPTPKELALELLTTSPAASPTTATSPGAIPTELLRDTSRVCIAKPSGELTQDEALDRIGMGFYQYKTLLMTGLVQGSYGMQVQMSSFIKDGVMENLRINETEFSTADAMMFAGMFFGTFLAGFASDRYGRRLTSLSWNVVALIGGLSLAASPNVFALSAAMFVTGFGIGGLHPSAALNVEVLPSSCRNLGVTLWTAFWTCGVLCECLIAAYTLTYSWRVTVIFSTIPVAVCMMFSFLWDESPRYLAMVGQHKQAHDVIRKIAKVNGRPDAFPSETVLARPTVSKQVPPKQAMKLLFASDIRVVTFILWLLWTTSNVSYYGFMIHANSEQFGSLSRYASTAITTCGELPSFPLQLYLGDGVGRRQAFVALATSLAALFVAMQVVGDSIALLKVVLFFLTRTFVNTLDNLLFTFTSEAYPTQIRSVGIGTCSAVARIFGILVPFLAIPLYAVSPWAATLVFAGINAGSALGATYLPFDTKGRALQDGAGDDTPREDSVPMEAIEK